jgi:hypothetical protein
MESEDLRKVLIFAIIFFGILLIASLIVLNNYNKVNQKAFSPQIVNTYTTYENPEIEYNIVNPVRTVQYIPTFERESIYNDYRERNYADYRDSYGQYSRRDFLGGYVSEYYVYILNKERTGKYFTVIFEFEDKNGYEYSEAVTNYIRAGEKEKFVYRDIQDERNEIVDWDYEVRPEYY